MQPREFRLESLHICRGLYTWLAARVQWPQKKADIGILSILSLPFFQLESFC